MMELEDVQAWALGPRNVGHVVCDVDQGWTTTLCDMWMAGWTTTLRGDAPPARVCSICRRRLKDCTLRERHA